MTIYGVYRGDEFIDVGTPQELAERLNVNVTAIYYWKSPHCHRLAELPKKDGTKRQQMVAVRVPEDDAFDLEVWNTWPK